MCSKMNFKQKNKRTETVSFASKRHKMRKPWKSCKERARERKQMLRLERQQKMKWTEKKEQMEDFINNMVMAEEMCIDWMDEQDNFLKHKHWNVLPVKFRSWVCTRYNHEMNKKPLIQEHMDMDEVLRLIMLSRKTEARATEAREEAERLEKQHKAIHALCMHKMHKYTKTDV